MEVIRNGKERTRALEEKKEEKIDRKHKELMQDVLKALKTVEEENSKAGGWNRPTLTEQLWDIETERRKREKKAEKMAEIYKQNEDRGYSLEEERLGSEESDATAVNDNPQFSEQEKFQHRRERSFCMRETARRMKGKETMNGMCERHYQRLAVSYSANNRGTPEAASHTHRRPKAEFEEQRKEEEKDLEKQRKELEELREIDKRKRLEKQKTLKEKWREKERLRGIDEKRMEEEKLRVFEEKRKEDEKKRSLEKERKEDERRRALEKKRMETGRLRELKEQQVEEGRIKVFGEIEERKRAPKEKRKEKERKKALEDKRRLRERVERQMEEERLRERMREERLLELEKGKSEMQKPGEQKPKEEVEEMDAISKSGGTEKWQNGREKEARQVRKANKMKEEEELIDRLWGEHWQRPRAHISSSNRRTPEVHKSDEHLNKKLESEQERERKVEERSNVFKEKRNITDSEESEDEDEDEEELYMKPRSAFGHIGKVMKKTYQKVMDFTKSSTNNFEESRRQRMNWPLVIASQELKDPQSSYRSAAHGQHHAERLTFFNAG